MKYRVEVNRSQFDALPVVVLPIEPDEPHADVIPVGTDVHVFTDAELRARDERIIKHAWTHWFDPREHDEVIDAIIAAAEADQ